MHVKTRFYVYIFRMGPKKGKARYKATSKSPRKLVRTPTKDTDDVVDGAEITLPASPRSASPSPTRSQPDLPEPVEVESQSQIISPVNSPAKRSRRAIESDEEEIDDAASVVVSISETEAMTPPKLPTQRRGSTTAKGTDDAVSTPPPTTVRNVRRPLYLARATSDKADNAPKTPTRSETLPRGLPSSSPSMLLAATRLSRARTTTKAKSSTVRSPAKSSTVRSPAKDLDAIDPRPAGTSSSRGTGKVKKPTASSTPRPRASVTAWLTSSRSPPAASKRALIDDEPEADDPDDDDFVDDDDEGNDTVVVNPDNIEPSQSQNR